MSENPIKTPLVVVILSFTFVGLAPLESKAAESKYRLNYTLDAPLTGLFLVGGALIRLIPVDTKQKWTSELLPFDNQVKNNFSAKSSSLSDTLLLTTIVSPLVAQLNRGINEEFGKTTLIYTEVLAGNGLLTGAVKYLVQRPRPYAYNQNPQVRKFEKVQGKDSRLSFYSGHSATAFSAAVAGSYLFSLSCKDANIRATFWSFELALASAIANLRVRAGKHYYSDVILGSIMGSAIGFIIPYLHQKKSIHYSPEPKEWGAMAGGIVFGIIASQLIPLKNDITLPIDKAPAQTRSKIQISLQPLALENSAGLMLLGFF